VVSLSPPPKYLDVPLYFATSALLPSKSFPILYIYQSPYRLLQYEVLPMNNISQKREREREREIKRELLAEMLKKCQML
jgi:hypothetical protein